MKKTYVLMAIAIIGIVSWCSSITADENIIDMGTIEYDNTIENPLQVKINSTELLILTYMYSDIDKSAIHIVDPYLEYGTYGNKTVYTFVALHIEVDWWFENNTKSFIYQDINTNQLYRVNVDYSEIIIPPNPVVELEKEYNESVILFNALEELFSETFNQLNETRENLESVWNIYNESKEEFAINSELVIQLRKDLLELDEEYNATKTLWISATQNLSIIGMRHGELTFLYDTLEKDHEELSFRSPIYIVFSIIGTGLILVLIFKRKKIFGQEEKTALELEIDTGYSPKADKIDKFVAGIGEKVGKEIAKVGEKLKMKDNKDVMPETKLPEPENNIQNIHKEIDKIKSENAAFQKSIVTDFQDIRKGVDAIKTKLEIE